MCLCGGVGKAGSVSANFGLSEYNTRSLLSLATKQGCIVRSFRLHRWKDPLGEGWVITRPGGFRRTLIVTLYKGRGHIKVASYECYPRVIAVTTAQRFLKFRKL